MTKLLILTSKLKKSGPNNVIKSLISGLKNQHIDVYLSPLSKKYDIDYVDDLEIGENKIFFQRGLFSLLHLIRIINQIKPDCVNTHGIRADFYLLILSFFYNFKIISTIHNVPTEDYFFRYNKFLANLMVFFHSFVFRNKKIIKVPVSYQVKKCLEGLDGVNLHVIYNGVSHNDFDPKAKLKSNSLKKDFDLGKNRKKILFCGHLVDLKDPLIVASIAPNFPEIDFIFLGDGYLKDRISDNDNDNVYVLGRVDNVCDYLLIADYYIMPSLTEGMPMALIEAMLMDLPVICSNIPIFREISKIENTSLFLFETSSRKELVSLVSEVINIDGFLSNRSVALKKFTSESMAKSYLGIINDK